MVRDTVAHLRAEGRRVFLDAEHFFDGYRSDPAYALEVLRTAAEAGADVAVLCDTNGGMLPDEVADVVHAVRERDRRRGSGIHCHNDAGCAVANSLAAVDAGATHVQGTAQRLRRAHRQRRHPHRRRQPRAQDGPRGCCRRALLREATRIAHAVSELANVPPYTRQPYVGASAFAHKAGLHASAVKGRPDALPARATRRRSATTCGCSSPTWPAARRSSSRAASSATTCPATTSCSAGSPTGSRTWRAAATPSRRPTRPSSCCCARRSRAAGRTSSRSSRGGSSSSADGRRRRHAAEATVKVRAGGERDRRGGRGQRPGQRARPRAAQPRSGTPTPSSTKLELIDYRVRIVDAAHGTDAVTRVLVETSDGETLVGDRRRPRQHHRGLLGGAGRRRDLRPAAASRRG